MLRWPEIHNINDSHGLHEELRNWKARSQEHRTQGQDKENENCRSGRLGTDGLGGRDSVQKLLIQSERANKEESRAWG